MTSLTDMPADIVEAAEKLANDILVAAGSGFRHYTPSSKEKIIAVAAAHIAASQRDQWQDIATAPKDGTQILVSIHGWNDPAENYFFAVVEWEDGRWMEGSDAVYPPNHWMPLPAPPKGGA